MRIVVVVVGGGGGGGCVTTHNVSFSLNDNNGFLDCEFHNWKRHGLLRGYV